MRANGLVKLLAGTALVATFGLATAASATSYVVVPGSGYDSVASGIPGVGNSGTDAFGNTWEWNNTVGGVPGPGAGFSAWGTPGLGFGDATYEGSAPADLFAVSFVVDHTGATFDEAPSTTPGGYTELTRMTVNGVAWTPVFLDSGNEVDFYAPAGDSLNDGQQYFVNVIFNQKTLSGANIGFSAVFLTAVPEASTWAMMIVGIAGIGGAMRTMRRKVLTSFIGA
jgi:hypothetical protein